MLKIHRLENATNKEMVEKLKKFESVFRYPLGDYKTFSISHGDHYLRFYQSMGPALCLVAEQDNNIVGSFSCALRVVINKHTNKKEVIAYLGDLKIIPEKQNTSVFYKLAQAMISEIQKKTQVAIAVVMDGNAVLPDNYSGRLNIPAFYPIEKFTIFSIQTQKVDERKLTASLVSDSEGSKIYRKLCRNDYYFEPEKKNLRSKNAPTWIASADHKACGRIEDTMLAKRLFDDNNQEIHSAHLCDFSFDDPISSIDLLFYALDLAYQSNFSSIFLTTNEEEAALLIPYLNIFSYEKYQASIYGTINAKSVNFKINSAEI